MITAVYIPILSGAILIFTGLRISATLRRKQNVPIRLRQISSHDDTNVLTELQPSAARSSRVVNSLRTVRILTCTGVAYFLFWSPYVTLVMVKCLVGSFTAPAGVEFALMWLANANSAVNVFIYSSTNRQFRRQCVLLASRLCCSRLSSHLPADTSR